MPFIPRGDGAAREAEFALSREESDSLQAAAKKLKSRKLYLRWNDFSHDRAAVIGGRRPPAARRRPRVRRRAGQLW
jgi:hypothetical protein